MDIVGIGESILGTLDEGGGMGPVTLTVASFTGKGKYGGALKMNIQGDMTLGMFYDSLMRHAKSLGISAVPIERVTGSFNYGASNETYLFFELSYDDEKDVIETMQKAASSRVKVVVMTPENMTPGILDTAKETKAVIQKRGKPGSLEW